MSRRSANSGFTLIELMVSVGILLVLGMMLIGFLRGAVTISRTGVSRGKVYESSQVIMRLAAEDFSQVLGPSPRTDGPDNIQSFLVVQDPFGREIICFTRAFGEEPNSLAGYDSARGGEKQGYASNFEGWNVNDRVKSTGGNVEVCYMLEPTGAGANLYRAVQSPPGDGGLIDEVGEWLIRHANSPADAVLPQMWWTPRRFDRRFNLVAENVLGFCVECWDENTTTWQPRSTAERGPRTMWSYSEQRSRGAIELPYALRLTIIIAADPPIRADARLMTDIGRDDTYLSMENTDNFPDVGTPNAYCRVDGEIMAFGTKGGGGLGSLVRGQYGTRAQGHLAGARVRAGEAFSRIIHLPVTR
ncbi:MAG: prepilin-type N-terminal cleavage/methylation domain-containing protein [Planctomycetes bacterium]|nr:prepilin-type N-terminal cleavage/methylation domain-containing protein [Planctomycetota bacterium]